MKKNFNESSRRSASRYRLVDFYTIRETVSQKTTEAGGSPVTEQLIREYHFHTGKDPSRPQEPYASEWKQVGDEIIPLATKKLAEFDQGEVKDAYQALVIFGGDRKSANTRPRMTAITPPPPAEPSSFWRCHGFRSKRPGGRSRCVPVRSSSIFSNAAQIWSRRVDNHASACCFIKTCPQNASVNPITIRISL